MVEKGIDIFGSRPYFMDSASNESFCTIRDNPFVTQTGPWKSTLTDVIDLLPSDPFEMDNSSNVNTREQLMDGHVGSGFSHQISTRLKISSDFFQDVIEIDMHPRERVNIDYLDAFPSKMLIYERSVEAHGTYMQPCNAERHSKTIDCGLYCETLHEALQIEVNNNGGGSEGDGVMFYERNHGGSEEDGGGVMFYERNHGGSEEDGGGVVLYERNPGGSEEDGGPPHEGLFFALGYLGVEDLLAVEKVCKSLHNAVQTDPLLWRCLHINYPLNKRFTDDALLQLSQRAKGRLQCLDLVDCFLLTDSGLNRVVQNNPGITKLSVPGCSKLSVDGVVNSLKLVKTLGMPPMKHLRLSGIFGASRSHYKDLKSLVDMDRLQHSTSKPRFYHISDSLSSCDYKSVIDIEVCPRCQELKAVYDCPSDTCKGKASNPCRACKHCILRCSSCGRCISELDYEETFCLDFICVDCWVHYMQCEKEQPNNNVKRDWAG